MSANATNDLLWRQYAIHVDLYKTHLDLVLKFNVLFYGLTGAIVSYYLSRPERRLLSLALILPLVLGVGLAVATLQAARAMRRVSSDIASIALSLGLETVPDLGVLIVLLRLSGTLFVVASVGLLALLFWQI